MTSAAREAPVRSEAPPSKYDAHILQLDREAIEAAYREQVVHLFAVWMKDGAGQPGRAATGTRQARAAYIAAMTEIEKRERTNP